jgi:lipoyl(octanoyl) transferase
MSPRCRLLPYQRTDGARNMAADEVMLEAAVGGTASLRFYEWQPATLSLGYFQPEGVRRDDERLTALPYVRRLSGGMTLVHHHEATYALALPNEAPWQTREGHKPWLCRAHGIIAEALRGLGIATETAACGDDQASDSPLCFHHVTPGDLKLGPAKVVGSAQRRQRGALLQHGAVLLAASPATPSLPGIHELTGLRLTAPAVIDAITRAWTGPTGWEMVPASWTDAEAAGIERLAQEKYRAAAWNAKR